MKTGFTNKSKYSLVATASRDGHHLISVVLGADNKDIRASVATSLLNRGFKMLENGTAPVVKNTPTTPVASYTEKNNNTSSSNTNANKIKLASGMSGVQFGAFSSRDAAMRQVKNVEQLLNITPVIEMASGGLYRVRINNLSENAAQSLRNSATAAGIDNYVFH